MTGSLVMHILDANRQPPTFPRDTLSARATGADRCMTFLRKHSTALAAIAVFNLVFFFPVIFMGRVLSPNDILYNYSPWSHAKPAAAGPVQNQLLNDIPTGYFTLMSLARSDADAFHWNPYVGAGIPGFGSAAAAVLCPLVLLPLLAVPLVWIYTALAFVKLNLSFLFAYLWLREERLGKGGAAIGALVIAGAGVYSVRWLWQITNATVLYPALLWIVRRSFNGRPVPVVLTAAIAFSYAVAGFPATMAYGAWVVLLWSIALDAGIHRRRAEQEPAVDAVRRVARPLAGVVIGLLLAVPFLVPFVQLVRRTGYLNIRQSMSLANVFPAAQWESFIHPDRLGNPAHRNWIGDRSLGVLNNYVELTVYVGLLTIPLVLLGLFRRRLRGRWFWAAMAALILAASFGLPGIAHALAAVPGIKYSPLARLALALPIPLGYLAGAARLRRRSLFTVAAVVVAFDLGWFAGRFHPYLEPERARVPSTPMTEFLRGEPRPFRVAPFFDYLWPNTSELVRVEDVRSHFGSEASYRRMLVRIDPTAWSGASTVLSFNSLKFDFSDPLTRLLGIRWYIEHRPIDIVKWTIFGATVPGVKQTSPAPLPLAPGQTMERTVRVDAEPFWSIELPVSADAGAGTSGRLEVTLLRRGEVVWSRAFSAAEINAIGKIYVPLRPYARLGDSVLLRIRSTGLRCGLVQGENAAAGEAPLFYGRVTTPLMFDRELPDGRLFRNLGELPRFRAVSRLRVLGEEEFLARRDIDFESEAVITQGGYSLPPQYTPGDARVTLESYAPDEQRLTTSSTAAFFLASSEKLTPELGVTIDGKTVQPVEVDMLFAGVPVPAGRHQVVFSRRIGRGWWWTAWVGLALFAIAGWSDLRAQKLERRAQSAEVRS